MEPTVRIVRLLFKNTSDDSVVVVGRFLQPWIKLEKLFNRLRDEEGCKGCDTFVAEEAIAVLVVPNDLKS
jgi:hypothetical protein